jgi:hypothetical protein
VAQELGIHLMNRLHLTLLLAVAAVGCWGCERPSHADAVAEARPAARPAAGPATRPAASSATRPAASSAIRQLLLLDDDEPGPGQELRADNSRCHVCHINFEREELSLKHARAGVGCVGCHGESDEHIADESWASGGNGTAPDIMYPRDRINPGCLKCHKDNLDPITHQAFLAGRTEQKQCTQCHGKHLMVNRRCVWK